MAAVTHITGQKALLTLREQFPNSWQVHFKDGQSRLFKALNGATGEDAIQEAAAQCIMQNGPALAILAAAWVMIRKEQLEAEHLQLEIRACRIEEQLVKMKDTDWNQRDKETISGYYRRTIAAGEARINIILNEVQAMATNLGSIKTHHMNWVSPCGIVKGKFLNN